LRVAASFKIIMTTSVTRPYTQRQICKTQDQPIFLVSDWSCPKTDDLRPHHCRLVTVTV